MDTPLCPQCRLDAWAMNPFGWYCGQCGHQVAPDFSEDPAFDCINKKTP